jgi:cellobiose dehydrogenase (acceptor)
MLTRWVAINAGLFFEPPASDWDLYHPAGWKSIDMKASIQRLYARQASSNVTSRDNTRYLQSGYNASRKWLVEILHFEDVDINAKPDNKTRVFGHPVFDYSNGQRGGPVVSYLGQAQQRSNFHLQSNTRVLRVEREGSKVTGVKVLANNVERLVLLSVNGRVVLSGGAIQSPGILMFSGIGPPDELSALQSAGKLSVKRSDWINSTAVGSGLFDNPNTFIELEGDSIQSYAYSYDRPLQSDRKLYLQERSGPYSFASETSVFWDTLTHPDGSVVAFQGTTDSAGYGNFTSNKTMTLNIYGTSGLKSSGKVVLDKEFVPGPSDDVYYSDPQDAKYISNFIYKVFQGLPNAGLTPKNIPQNSTQQQIQAYITTPSAYAKGLVNHWSSSCRIGKCVDTNTTVIGMENLHVVDGSIIAPLTVNPQFGIMAAAERASELILALDGAKIECA